MKLVKLISRNTALALALTTTMACGGDLTGSGTSSSSGSSTTTTTAFPSDLAVASPLEVTTDTGSTNLSLSSIKLTTSATHIPAYAWATATINEILNSSSASLCRFDPELFLAQTEDADCYGPTVDYIDHPEATSGTDDGQLPQGDLGIWQENDATTGHACAAAELNARMQGIKETSLASLSGLASMICVINNSGGTLSMPSSSTTDLTAAMNALSITGVTFNAAALSEGTNADGNAEYSYNLDFDYDDGSDTHAIAVDMIHVPGASALEYTGQISFLVDNTSPHGGNCPTGDVTDNTSLQYVRDGLDDLDVQVRFGQFCGLAADGRDADGLVDPSNKYDSSSNPNGWGNNFSKLTANYDPTTLGGDYAYSWQAGQGDGNTRVFNLHVETMEFAAGIMVSAANTFFGYGDDIAATDGSVEGFICNWAGPGADHTLIDNAQFQEVAYDDASGTFISVASNITYAPTTACNYDGSSSFSFDADGDGDIEADDEADSVVTADDLYDAVDVDGNGDATMIETILDAGFTLPTI